ncbi:hypothetical protein [Aliarcobacter butzleri]|uniref:hypothetical protein n=1 Tax=Aliarcobacter butzleri TaxID=28197 RepID=UPI0034500AA9
MSDVQKILWLTMGLIILFIAYQQYLIKPGIEIDNEQYIKIYATKEELKDTSLDNLIKKSIVDGKITFKEQDSILEKIKEIRLINESKEAEIIKDNLKE